MIRNDESFFLPSSSEVKQLLSLPGFYAPGDVVPDDVPVWTLHHRGDPAAGFYDLGRLQRISASGQFVDPDLTEDYESHMYTYKRRPQECVRPGSEAERFILALLTVVRLLGDD